MSWLIIGVLLWAGAHLFKRLAPKARKGMGDAGKGLVAAGSLLAVVLMVIGYRMSDPTFHWALGGWAWHLNNLLMMISILLVGLANAKSRLRPYLRHPMLTGVILWSVAHLLVNGDLPSLILFGGIGMWAITEIVLINRDVPKWTAPTGLSARGDAIWLVSSAVAFLVIVGIHIWLGHNPFVVVD
jgi:uncharacterized membrane protein